MSAFDTTVTVGQAGLQAIEEENGKAYEAHLILQIVTLVPTPQGMAPLPLGVIRVPLQKGVLAGLCKQGAEIAEHLDERPNLVTASNVDEVTKGIHLPGQ